MLFKGAKYMLCVKQASGELKHSQEISNKHIEHMEQVLSNDYHRSAARKLLQTNAARTPSQALAINTARILASVERSEHSPDISRQEWVRFAVSALMLDDIEMDAALIRMSDLLQNAQCRKANLDSAVLCAGDSSASHDKDCWRQMS